MASLYGQDHGGDDLDCVPASRDSVISLLRTNHGYSEDVATNLVDRHREILERGKTARSYAFYVARIIAQIADQQ